MTSMIQRHGGHPKSIPHGEKIMLFRDRIGSWRNNGNRFRLLVITLLLITVFPEVPALLSRTEHHLSV